MQSAQWCQYSDLQPPPDHEKDQFKYQVVFLFSTAMSVYIRRLWPEPNAITRGILV